MGNTCKRSFRLDVEAATLRRLQCDGHLRHSKHSCLVVWESQLSHCDRHKSPQSCGRTWESMKRSQSDCAQHFGEIWVYKMSSDNSQCSDGGKHLHLVEVSEENRTAESDCLKIKLPPNVRKPSVLFTSHIETKSSLVHVLWLIS